MVKPQTKNVANSSQKVRVFAALARMPNVSAINPAAAARDGSGTSPGGAPKRVNPIEAGRSGTRKKTSGQNETDVLKRAHEIFYNNYKKKFTLEHAWIELRNEQKWCELASTKLDGSSKKRWCEDGAQSESSQGTINLDDPPTKRPVGVKAAKGGSSKRSMEDGKALSEFQTMWSLKEKDLTCKERLSKLGLLDRLIAKTEPLSEEEVTLKKKLITEMLAN